MDCNPEHKDFPPLILRVGVYPLENLEYGLISKKDKTNINNLCKYDEAIQDYKWSDFTVMDNNNENYNEDESFIP